MNHKILLIAAGICGLATSSQAALVAWYKFDEGAGATTALNAVVGSSTGAVGADVVTGVAGISGNAYQFGYTTSGAVPDSWIVDMGDASFFSGSTGLNSSTGVTYSLWMNSTTPQNNTRNVMLFSGSDTVANSYQDLGMSGQIAANGITVGSAYGRNRPPGAASAQQTGIGSDPTLINDGEWHHLAMTIDLNTATLSLYVDGVLANTQDFATGAVGFPVFNNFEIGRLGRSGTKVDAYNGLVDEVQVYNTALSAGDIQFLFANPGAAVPEPGTVALAGLGLGVLFLASRRRKAC